MKALELLGITKSTTSTYSPQQNGVAERKNRVILSAIRKTLMSSTDNREIYSLLPEIVQYATYIEHRTMRDYPKDDERYGKTAYELFYNIDVPKFRFRQFGIDCIVKFEQKETMRKFNIEAEKLDPLTCDAVFVGYGDESEANFRVILMNSKFTRFATNNVTFLETSNNIHIVAKQL